MKDTFSAMFSAKKNKQTYVYMFVYICIYIYDDQGFICICALFCTAQFFVYA